MFHFFFSNVERIFFGSCERCLKFVASPTYVSVAVSVVTVA